MAQGLTAQVLDEVRELRKDVHGIDIKLAEHLAQDVSHVEALSKVSTAVFGNGSKGLDDRVRVLEECQSRSKASETADRKFRLDIKSGAIVGAITLAMSLIAQWLVVQIH